MKLAICFGGKYEMYLELANILDLFDEYFKKRSRFTYGYNDFEIKIFFAVGPRKDQFRGHMFRLRRIPPAATKTARRIRAYDPDLVLFFGLAGALKQKLKMNDIIYPCRFKEIYLNSIYNLHKQDLTPVRSFRVENTLGADDVCNITTNLLFKEKFTAPGNHNVDWRRIWSGVEAELRARGIETRGKEAREIWTKIKFREEFLPRLREQGDLIEMESAVLARNFKGKVGIMLQIADIPGKVKLDVRSGLFDWKKFNESTLNNIFKILSC